MDNNELLRMLINARDETEEAYENHFREAANNNAITGEMLEKLTEERNVVIGALDARINKIQSLITQ